MSAFLDGVGPALSWSVVSSAMPIARMSLVIGQVASLAYLAGTEQPEFGLRNGEFGFQ